MKSIKQNTNKQMYRFNSKCETFRSKWQDCRENEENTGDPYHDHVINKTTLITQEKTNRKVRIKEVDVFGFESIVVESL